MKRLATALSVLYLTFVGTAQAQNLLINGNFELSPDLSIEGWDLTETITGMPGVSVNSAEVINFANQPMTIAGEAGLWLRAFAGDNGPLAGQNVPTNAHLSQTVPGTVGQQYTLTGWSRFETNYSGGVDTLDLLSPSGEIPSPTATTMLLEFLDSGGSVITSPVSLDVKADRFTQSPISFPNDNEWYQHTLMGTAPEGTTDVRVTAQATDMVFNLDDGGQSAFYDNLSLTTASEPATELLTNGDLNAIPPEILGWTLIEPVAVNNLTRGDDFADDPATPGSFGLWFRNFEGGDATALQRVAAIEGGDYTYTVSSAFNQNYPGGTGPAKPATLTLIELAFLDASEQAIGTPVTLDLWDAGQRNPPGPIENHPEAWDQFSVNGVAPAGTTWVEVRASAIGMVNQGLGANAAFFDDMILTLASDGVPGDYNNDGKVGVADFTAWRDNVGAPAGTLLNDTTGEVIGAAQYDLWRSHFGMMAGAGNVNVLSSAAVPEPNSVVPLLGVAIAVIGAGWRRWQ